MIDSLDHRGPLGLTLVLYDDTSKLSLVFALISLIPILLMPAYAALVVQTRELTIINMWAGQWLSEALNLVLKRTIKQQRPSRQVYGYGFPSSHSQYMGFFASFLICHLYARHRFTPMGSKTLDSGIRLTSHFFVVALAAAIAYSRYHLGYHTPNQIVWGLAIGVAFGVPFYVLTELYPVRRPDSALGRARTWLLENRVSTWLEVRDGWAVWGDGGRAEEWRRWRAAWTAARDRGRDDKSQ